MLAKVISLIIGLILFLIARLTLLFRRKIKYIILFRLAVYQLQLIYNLLIIFVKKNKKPFLLVPSKYFKLKKGIKRKLLLLILCKLVRKANKLVILKLV